MSNRWAKNGFVTRGEQVGLLQSNREAGGFSARQIIGRRTEEQIEISERGQENVNNNQHDSIHL